MKCHENLKFMQFGSFYDTFSSFQNFKMAILIFRLKIFSKIFGWKLAQNVPNRPKMPCDPKIYAIQVILWHFFSFEKIRDGHSDIHSDIQTEIFRKKKILPGNWLKMCKIGLKCHANITLMQFRSFYGTFSNLKNFELAILIFKLKIFEKNFWLEIGSKCAK